jgi:adenylate kinase
MGSGVRQRVVLLGPPASGKGTQADLISAAFGLPHLSTGALLRTESRRGSEIGRKAETYTSRGELVPDEMAVGLVTDWISENGCRFLLDGFPRTLPQAEILDAALASLKAPLDLVILLELGEAAIRDRILNRISCLACCATFRAAARGHNPGEPCPRCGNPLARRQDDTGEVLSQRLEVYRALTLTVLEYYDRTASGILHRIDGERGSDEIFSEISGLIAGKQAAPGR